MTAKPVEWVLDELGAVVDAVEANYTLANGDPVQLRRVDRDNSLLYDGGGTFDMSASMSEKHGDFKRANFVGATYADRSAEYIGTNPDLDTEEVVGVRIEGFSGGFGHVDPLGNDGIPFNGTDDALVQRIKDTLYDALKFPDAGRTPVSFTHLLITNEAPQSALWKSYHRYDMDISFSGFEEL
jgi:hypothetical protein